MDSFVLCHRHLDSGVWNHDLASWFVCRRFTSPKSQNQSTKKQSMRPKKPQAATLNEIQISRQGMTAIIKFNDPNFATTHLTLEEPTEKLTDQDILNRFNAVILAQERMSADYKHVAVEVPIGRPQLRYYEQCSQYSPRGDVLRCQIEGDEHGNAFVCIDDRELSMDEFGKLLLTHDGWGMRLVFVPDDELADTPSIVVRDPEDD